MREAGVDAASVDSSKTDAHLLSLNNPYLIGSGHVHFLSVAAAAAYSGAYIV